MLDKILVTGLEPGLEPGPSDIRSDNSANFATPLVFFALPHN